VRVAIVGAAALILVSCAGTVSRQEFHDAVRARGGGLSEDLIVDAVAAVGDDQGTDLVQIRSVSVAPGRVALEVRPYDGPDDDALVAYGFGRSASFDDRAGGLFGPTPVERSSTEPPVVPSTFTLEQAGVDRFDRVVGAAIEEAGLAGGYAVGAEIRRPVPSAEPQIEVQVTSSRGTARVTFAADGTLVGVEQ
jgi:hypothetical protein